MLLRFDIEGQHSAAKEIISIESHRYLNFKAACIRIRNNVFYYLSKKVLLCNVETCYK